MLGLLQSYLAGRHQFTEIQGIQSRIRKSPECSVIQGSKLSGLLYTIYTNEVPKLHLLLQDSQWMEERLGVKKENYSGITHTVVNFVDDSNSFLSFDDPDDANHYLNRYFLILVFFYIQNKLLINPEKTTILVVAKPQKILEADDIRIVTEKEEVRPSKQVKILGWITNPRMNMDNHLDLTI